MKSLAAALYHDQNGFIISAELVLVSTICVMGMIVGLTEVSFNVNQELEDVGSAVGSVNQTFRFNGASGFKGGTVGSCFGDSYDDGDSQTDISCNVDAAPES